MSDQPETRIYSVAAVGMHFRPSEAKVRYSQLVVGETVILEREPNNPHDGNAVQVWDQDHEHHLAYVKATMAENIAPLMDSGEWTWHCIYEASFRGALEVTFTRNGDGKATDTDTETQLEFDPMSAA